MQLVSAPIAHTPPSVSPISWLLVEQRGPLTSNAGRYDLTTLEFWTNNGGEATLTDGRMSYPHDSGTPMFVYQPFPYLVRDGVDPDHAAAAAREGAALVASSVERAVGDLGEFAIAPGQRLPRDPDTYEIWLRRDSGERARYIVPYERTPASLRDAQAAARSFADVLRTNYDRQDPMLAAGVGVAARITRTHELAGSFAR